jgi:hypothetical protein
MVVDGSGLMPVSFKFCIGSEQTVEERNAA